jgi:hypothetical protein
LGIYGILSSSVIFIVLLVQYGSLSDRLYQESQLLFALRITELLAAVFATFAFSTIPRRPTVFIDGKPVDGMFAASAFDRYSFGE